MPTLAILNLIPCFSGSTTTCKDRLLYEGKKMRIFLPAYSLAPESLRVEPKEKHRRWQDWDREEDIESYELIQKIVEIWKSQGISDYIVLGTSSEKTFCWHVIPFSKECNRFLSQLQVALRFFLFGGYPVGKESQELQEKKYQSFLSELKTPLKKEVSKVTKETADAFCQERVIANQQIMEGKEIRILYDYKPLAYHHFLAIPKRHAKKFSNLSLSEYLEETALTKRIINFFEKKGYHIFHKSGKRAGQTVPHWHQHIVFSYTLQEEIWGKLNVLKKMILGAFPLGKTQLKERVNTFQKQFLSL